MVRTRIHGDGVVLPAKETKANYSKTEIEAWAKGSNWQKLEIIDCKNGLSGDSVGEVEFKAYYYNTKNTLQIHHERSVFKKENGDWFYVSGTVPTD